MTAPYWLNPATPDDFPHVALAAREPDGLLAIGGDLSVARLRHAYRRGIFPWYSEQQPILWWSPDPRSVLFPEKLHVSRSLRKTLRRQIFEIRVDQAFTAVIQACSEDRAGSPGTWIVDEMREAYTRLHQAGDAHSIECWQNGELVGGVYGVEIGKVFFGESMFSRVNDASKVAFVYLTKLCQSQGFGLIDCQIRSPHLDSLGAETIPRDEFVQWLDNYCEQPVATQMWRLQTELLAF